MRTMIESEEQEGRTALLMASAGGSAEVVLALLERGAQVDKPDTVLSLPLPRPSPTHSPPSAALPLLRVPPPLLTRCSLLSSHLRAGWLACEGRTALWAAARFGNLAVVEALLKAGAGLLPLCAHPCTQSRWGDAR
eukprot:720304-Rhodomonas_salina.4